MSVKNAIAVVRPILGLFDDKQDLRGTAVAGFDAEWIHGSYHNDSDLLHVRDSRRMGSLCACAAGFTSGSLT